MQLLQNKEPTSPKCGLAAPHHLPASLLLPSSLQTCTPPSPRAFFFLSFLPGDCRISSNKADTDKISGAAKP